MFCDCCTSDKKYEEFVHTSSNSFPGLLANLPDEDSPQVNQDAPAMVDTTSAAEQAMPEKKPAVKFEEPSVPPPQLEVAATTITAPKKREVEIPMIRQEGSDLGLDVDYGNKKTLVIVKVKDGVCKDWNNANPYCPIEEGDEIISANGRGGTSNEIISQIQGARDLKFILAKGREFEVCIDKPTDDEPLGIEIDADTGKVSAIQPGPIEVHNSKMSVANHKITEGVLIIKVNEATAPRDIITELATKKRLQVSFAPSKMSSSLPPS